MTPQTAQAPTSQTIAQRVRAKYPGEYDDLTDQDLESKVLAKYPEYADLPRTPPASNAVPNKKNSSNPLFTFPGADLAVSIAKGAGKGALEMVKQGGDLIRKIPGVQPALNAIGDPKVQIPVNLESQDAGETTGKIAVNVAAAASPTRWAGTIGMLAKTKTAAELLRMFPALPALAKAAGMTVDAFIQGATQAALAKVQGGNPVAAGVVGGALAPITSAAPAVQSSAEETMVKAMGRPGGTGPTDRNLLAKAKDVAPRLLDENFGATSSAAAAEKAQASLAAANDVLDTAASLSPGQLISTAPVISKLQKIRAGFNSSGVSGSGLTAGMEGQAAKIDAMIDTLKRNGVMKFDDLRKLRQQWDSLGNWDRLATTAQNAEAKLYRSAANFVRGEIAANQPMVAAANKDVSFWNDTLDVLERSAERPGQSASIGVPGWTQVIHLVRSPAFRFLGANLKRDLASALESGQQNDIAAAVMAANRAITGGKD